MEFGKEVLTFQIQITGADELKGIHGEASMVYFTGTCDCEIFKGKLLPGGVDTQKQYSDKPRSLSARYMLEGEDKEGKKCRIFVENNAKIKADGQLEYTIPTILTDSEALSFLETVDLKGTITPAENGITIHIYMK